MKTKRGDFFLTLVFSVPAISLKVQLNSEGPGVGRLLGGLVLVVLVIVVVLIVGVVILRVARSEKKYYNKSNK